MQMVYNSDSYVVVQFDVVDNEPGSARPLRRGGYEIVDKFAGRGLFIEGAVAEGFRAGVQALVETDPGEDAFDDFIAGYTQLALQPVRMH